MDAVYIAVPVGLWLAGGGAVAAVFSHAAAHQGGRADRALRFLLAPVSRTVRRANRRDTIHDQLRANARWN